MMGFPWRTAGLLLGPSERRLPQFKRHKADGRIEVCHLVGSLMLVTGFTVIFELCLLGDVPQSYYRCKLLLRHTADRPAHALLLPEDGPVRELACRSAEAQDSLNE